MNTHHIAHSRPQQRPFFAILLKVIAALAFTLMAATVKYAGTGVLSNPAPVGQLVFFRSFFALLPVLLWLSYARPLSAAFATKNLSGHLKRGLIGSCGMFCGFAGLMLLPLPDATAISFAAPLLSVVLAHFLLKEVVRVYRWTAVLIGFVGVIIMLLPHLSLGGQSTTSGLGAMFGLGGALCAAFAMIEVRRLTATEHTAAIVVYFSLFTTVMSLFSYPLGYIWPEYAWFTPQPMDFLILGSVGFLGGIGQILLTQSYKFADASVVAPFDYTSMIWALLIGWFAFSNVPDPLVLIGAAIVISSGIFVILRERALGIERKRQRKAGTGRAL